VSISKVGHAGPFDQARFQDSGLRRSTFAQIHGHQRRSFAHPFRSDIDLAVLMA
jgi:hypothetical protein